MSGILHLPTIDEGHNHSVIFSTMIACDSGAQWTLSVCTVEIGPLQVNPQQHDVQISFMLAGVVNQCLALPVLMVHGVRKSAVVKHLAGMPCRGRQRVLLESAG